MPDAHLDAELLKDLSELPALLGGGHGATRP